MPGSNFVFRSEARAIGHFKRNYILQMASESLWVRWMMCWKSVPFKTHTSLQLRLGGCEELLWWFNAGTLLLMPKSKWWMNNYWLEWQYEDLTSQQCRHWFGSWPVLKTLRIHQIQYIKIELSWKRGGGVLSRPSLSVGPLRNKA